ncbi:MAG TPA: trypsin-like peptidase domain-containing protein [Vicinamibacteria bacterium]
MSTEALLAISDGLADLVEAAGPSVVRVEGRRGTPASGVVFGDDVVVTAHHVLEWDEDVAVGLADGGAAEAQLVGRDPGTDLAVLRVKAGGLKAPQWSEPDGLRPGHLVVAVSRPGSRVRAGLGMVSARGGAWRTHGGGRLDHDIRVDVSLHPGFSGGLAVDARGRALGMSTAGLARSVAVVVPAATLQRVAGSLLKHGHLRRGYLGVGLQPVRLPANAAAAAGQDAGLLVVGVEPGSPADRAGVLLGDVVLALDAEALRHPADLLPLLEEDRIGAAGTLRLLRAGEVRDLAVTVGVRGEGQARP